jgi:hypothetical protein
MEGSAAPGSPWTVQVDAYRVRLVKIWPVTVRFKEQLVREAGGSGVTDRIGSIIAAALVEVGFQAAPQRQQEREQH